MSKNDIQHFVINVEDLFVSSSSDESDNNSFRRTTPINIKRNNDIKIENIAGEDSLIEYTDNHYNSNVKYNEHYYCSDSPITMSNNNSDNEMDNIYDSDDDIQEKNTFNMHENYKKLTYDEVEKSLSKYYNNENKYSGELDILITYLKGQKVLYKYSNRIAIWKLNALTIPAIFLTATLAIFTPFMEEYKWSIGFIATLNGFITLFISLINYLKLESSAEMYLHLANQFDKLETSMEFASNKIAFIENEKEQKKIVLKKINELERKMTEIKELNNVLIPNELKKLFPVIFHINVFSFIKKIEISKKKLIMKFKDIKNEIKYIFYKWKKTPNDDSLEKTREKNRLEYLLEVKNKIKEELHYYTNSYSYIDSVFINETYYVEKHNLLMSLLFLKKRKYYTNIKEQNPIVSQNLQCILGDI
jgi:hypothetical protein